MRMNTLLWAVNSRCYFNCKYCYLKFSDDINPIDRKACNDLSCDELLQFVSKMEYYKIKRIFIAGAEPLSNAEITFKIIKRIKEFDIQVILCTNGYGILENYEKILESKIDGVSISLDSSNKFYNNTYRNYPTSDGFEKVVQGSKILIQEKNRKKSNLKVGFYTVLTKKNIKDLEETYQFVCSIGADYYIFQPIFLMENHELYKSLTLSRENINDIRKIICHMVESNRKTKLPNKKYLDLLITSIYKKKHIVECCFGGDNLFFITPDGGIHACPSGENIKKEKTKKTIINDLDEVIYNKSLKKKICNDFSSDCVNMWQLMAFDEIL